MSQDIANEQLASEVTVSIADAHRALFTTMPTGMADITLAALMAEPETLEELETAVTRYCKPFAHESFLARFEEGLCEEPWDAGVMIIDLATRLVVAETEPALYKPGACGYVAYCPELPPEGTDDSDGLDEPEDSEDEAVAIHYQLPDDWLFVDSCDGWVELRARRSRERLENPPFDARPVLFDKAPEFIVRECLASRDAGAGDPIAAIHEKWLMTPRDDLRGKTPREILLEKREFIDFDLNSRATQWSFVGECPPPLSRESAAYRFAGFGTHSNVVYFDFVRSLLDHFWFAVESGPANSSVEDTVRFLVAYKEDWLKKNDKHTRSPQWIMEQERLRLPVTASAEEVMIDHDCPLCQMAADPEFGPTFWHLDGSGMDLEDNWVFSFHPTRESWEAERREWEERSRKFYEEQAQRRAETEWAGGERIFDDRKPTAERDEEDIPF